MWIRTNKIVVSILGSVVGEGVVARVIQIMTTGHYKCTINNTEWYIHKKDADEVTTHYVAAKDIVDQIKGNSGFEGSIIEAVLMRYFPPDDPTADQTPFQSDAFTRGEDCGFSGTCEQIEKAIQAAQAGEQSLSGVTQEPLQSLRQKIFNHYRDMRRRETELMNQASIDDCDRARDRKKMEEKAAEIANKIEDSECVETYTQDGYNKMINVILGFLTDTKFGGK